MLNCYGMPESIGSDGDSKCLCSSGYRWDIHAGQCIKRNSISTAVGLAIGIPLGLIALCGIAAIGWCTCKDKKKKP